MFCVACAHYTDAPMKRRVFLSALMTGAAGALAPRVQTQERRAVRPVPRVRRGTQILVKGGTVLSLDPKVGDFDVADVLIDGATIAAVGPNLSARADAAIVDASHAIVMPGFIDTHRHMWEGPLRNI